MRPATVRVVVGVCALAGAVIGMALAGAADGADPSWAAVGILGICVAVGEALRATLPYGHGHVARFGHADAVILAGVVLRGPAEVTLGASLGVLLLHLANRTEPLKATFNVGQMTVSTAAASAVFGLFTQPGAAISPSVLLPYAAAAATFMLVNTALVGTIVATVTRDNAWRTVRRLVAPTAVLTAGGASLGLLALGLLEHHVYLVPAIGVPLVFLLSGSRQQVDAQLREERSRRLVAFERTLARAWSAEEIDTALIDGIRSVTNASAAVLREGTWATPVPHGSDPRPPTSLPLGLARGRAADLGLAVEATAVLLPLENGPRKDGPSQNAPHKYAPHKGGFHKNEMVAAWGGDLSDIKDTADWIQRLVRSAAEQAERSRAHATLLHERATLRTVVEGTGDGIYMLDGQGTVLLINPAMAALIDTDAQMVVGHPAVAAFGTGDWSNPGVRDVQRRSDGAITVWRVTVAAMSDDGGDSVRVGVVHDVSAERRLTRMKDDMLAVVSHELRTPLTPIRGAAQLLAARWQRLSDDQRSQLLAQLTDRAEHMTRMVEDLLLVAQMSSEDGRAPQPAYTTADIAAAVAQDVAHQNATRAQDVVYEGPTALVGRTDLRRLRQILDNLVDNACKFSPASSPVHVRLEPHGSSVLLSVTDHGPGIRTEDRQRIFDRFERGEDPLHMRTSGAGLGLYIVRSLVTALGGDMRVESTVGQGTSMILSLPLTAHIPEVLATT